MLKYFFSLLFLISLHCGAQPIPEGTLGLRFGLDLSKFIYKIFEPDRTAIETSIDLEVKNNLFVVAEPGWFKVDLIKTKYEYSLSGSYVKLGLDYNFYKHETAEDNDIVYGGLRYGFNLFKHEASNIVIYDKYWGDYSADILSTSHSGHWIEFVSGIKTELFLSKNIFLGLSLRGKILLSDGGDEFISPYIIPGYGKGNKKVATEITYSLMYRIPVRTRSKPLKETVK